MASTIMQVYLTKVLDSFFHSQFQVRLSALSVINLVLQQGLVHPVQCVPYLISMCTDEEQSIRVKADQQLQEIEKQYPGFIHVSISSNVWAKKHKVTADFKTNFKNTISHKGMKNI